MPNKKNAEKALRQSKARQIKNNKVKLSIYDMKRKIRKALEQNVSAEELKKLYTEAQTLLDKAAKNNVIKKNSAARKKSSIAKMISPKEAKAATTKKTTAKKTTTKKAAAKKTATKKTTAKKTTKK